LLNLLSIVASTPDKSGNYNHNFEKGTQKTNPRTVVFVIGRMAIPFSDSSHIPPAIIFYSLYLGSGQYHYYTVIVQSEKNSHHRLFD
jgi:hypothetical protein